MEKLFYMSDNELDRYNLVTQVLNRRTTQLEAAKLLGISDRHFRRLLKAYKKEGADALLSKRRGKPSNNRYPEEIKAKAINLLKTRYRGFGPTFAKEKLFKEHSIKVSHETLRKWMIKEGLWKEKQRKHPRIHQSRSRRPYYGELIQADGSPHDWFEGRHPKCCLMGFIDDATSSIMHLKFVKSESTESYFASIREYIETHGRPTALYTDRLSVFRVNREGSTSKNRGLTQVGRALKELEIDLICANSPQAKGRVERLFNTLQDRLVKELSLRGISTIKEANAYLPKYITEHNEKFSVKALEPGDVHRELKESHNLDKIFCYKATRKLTKNLELSYEGRILQVITERPSYAMRGANVDVIEEVGGDVYLYYKGTELKYKELLVRDRQGRILNRKSLCEEKIYSKGRVA